MSEDVQHSQPRGWKAFQANYDYVFSLSDRLCCVALSQQQIAALLSQVEYLYWPSRWVKADGDVDADFVTQFTEDLERNLMTPCCDDNLPIQWRYTSDGVLQQSTNGGGTWVDAPLYDPRVYSPQFPPLPGDDGTDKKCAAATGAVALIKEQVGDQLTDDMSRYTLSQLISDWTNTVINSGGNIFQALATVVTNQIFALVIATLRPALTDDVYHTLQCILYCDMADDATFNNAQWATVRSDILSQITGIAGVFLEHLVYLLGTGGLTNLARSGAATSGDCSDCDCGLCGEDWQVGYYYLGVYSAFGTLLDSGIDMDGHFFMTVQSFDRGDGLQAVSVTSPASSVGCNIDWTLSETADIISKAYAPNGTVPDYSTMITNDLLVGGDYTMVYFLSHTAVFTATFTFG